MAKPKQQPVVPVQRVVPSVDVAALHSLTARVQARVDRLSACLADGAGLGSKLQAPELLEFCQRELQTFLPKDGEPWPAWRYVDSYKIPEIFKLSRDTIHSSEERYLTEMDAELRKIGFEGPTRDFWINSVGDAEDMVKRQNDQVASGKGFSLLTKNLPATYFSKAPEVANMNVNVITPTEEIREVIRRTRAEFTRRLLELDQSIVSENALKSAADGRFKRWSKAVGRYLLKHINTVCWSVIGGLALLVVGSLANNWLKARGINITPWK